MHSEVSMRRHHEGYCNLTDGETALGYSDLTSGETTLGDSGFASVETTLS